MPKSKRDKKISLTKTNKKGLELKKKIIDDVQNCVNKYNSIYVFTFSNMRNEKMQQVREEWKPSRFFFAKNRVVTVGLGKTKEDEYQTDLHKLTSCLKGQCGILFTDSPLEEVVDWFNAYSCEEYARAGFKATRTVKLDEGPLKQFPHSIEPYLRQLGMPTKLERGVVTLLKDFTVCKKDAILTPEQAKILELLEIRLATFKLSLKARWAKDDKFMLFDNEDEVGQDSDDEDGDMEVS